MRAYNFSAGPAILPEEVLTQASAEMLNFQKTGMSVMEMSHRSPVYETIFYQAQNDLRTLMNIPDNYQVLFLQGGASAQFAMVPLNISANKKMDYINTGIWTKKAIKEAQKIGDVSIPASSEDKNFSYIPQLKPDMFRPDADYVYIVSNNTIYGTRYTEIPNTGAIPLVADMSSNILSEPLDVSQFGIIFAGAQKNIGPAGLTVVIIREDLIGTADKDVPYIFNYKTHSEAKSMYNTPPTYAVYLAGLVFKHLLALGGLSEIQTINVDKANLLYDYLDESTLFNATVEGKQRSLMNIPFITDSAELNSQFIAEAESARLVNLKGHRSVGGMRASLYNAMPANGVAKLVSFMKEFETKNG